MKIQKYFFIIQENSIKNNINNNHIKNKQNQIFFLGKKQKFPLINLFVKNKIFFIRISLLFSVIKKIVPRKISPKFKISFVF